MNWGTSIVVGMAIAMTAVVAAGVYMVSHDHDSLEEGDYYEKGLNYNADYDRKENVLKQHEAPHISIQDSMLVLIFTEKGNAGTLVLRRPSNQLQDKKIRFNTAGDRYETSLQGLAPGAWQLQLNWQRGSVPFLYEQDLFLKAESLKRKAESEKPY